MPCDTLRTTTVDLGKVDPTILTDALNRMGLNAQLSPNGYIRFDGGSYHRITGELTLSGSNTAARTSEIKQGYSAQVVRSQAKRFGWQVKETGKNQFQVIKGAI